MPSLLFLKTKISPPLIANCVRLLTGSFNLSICVVYLILKCSIKQFCVCTLIPSWLKKYQYSENKLPIEAQSRSLSLIYVSDMIYNVTTSINTYICSMNLFLVCAFYDFITEFVVHCVHLDLDICTWTYHLLNLS